MRNMKKDMGGAAHAIALAELVMARKLPLRLHAAGAGGRERDRPRMRSVPAKCIATRQGLTVEIDNTDAEGRVVLCDALTYAGETEAGRCCSTSPRSPAPRASRSARTCRRCTATTRRLAADWLAAGDARARSAVAHAAVAAVPALPHQHHRRHRQRRPVEDGRQHHRRAVPRALRAAARSGRTWTCTPGTTATARASPPAARRRVCARRSRCCSVRDYVRAS